MSQKTGNEIINFAYNPNGAPYGFTLNGTPYYYILNIQGDVTGIYDNSGMVVVNYVYDSWGRLESITGSLAATVGVKNPLRYRGYYYDTELEMYCLLCLAMTMTLSGGKRSVFKVGSDLSSLG